jgi:hypothetical protein
MDYRSEGLDVIETIGDLEVGLHDSMTEAYYRDLEEEEYDPEIHVDECDCIMGCVHCNQMGWYDPEINPRPDNYPRED